MSQDPTQKFLNNGVNFTTTLHSTSYPAITPTTTDLTNKVILITGASKGVGRALAISCAQAGASHIILAARSSLSATTSAVLAAAEESKLPPPTIISLTIDVSSLASVEASLETLLQHPSFPKANNPKIDILINNAGYLKPFESIGLSDPDEWCREWDVNIKGTYFVTRTFLPLVLASQSKTVVNIASIGALFASPGSSGYQTSKLAMLRFTEFLMNEYGSEGLLALVLHPGGVATELASNLSDEYKLWLVDEPELAADTVVWMTKERREWLAARYVSVNWDMEELEEKKEDILKGDLLKVRLAVNLF